MKTTAVPEANETSPDAASRFMAFIEQAKAVLPSRESPVVRRTAPQQSLPRFEAFVGLAKPIVAEQIKGALRKNRKRLDNLSRWLMPHSCDILSAAGLSENEVRYTSLIAWMLWPEGRPDLALGLQRAWLEALGLHDVATRLAEAVKPATEFATDDGRADLVLNFRNPGFVLIVEAKIGTEEHTTPDDEWQTEGYPASVRRRLGVPLGHPGVMVFLTPDGREPHDKAAIVTTYEKLVGVIADTLSPEAVGPDLRWAYAGVITHLLSHAAPGGSAAVEGIRQYAGRRAADFADDQVLQDVAFLGPLCRTLSKEEPL